MSETASKTTAAAPELLHFLDVWADKYNSSEKRGIVVTHLNWRENWREKLTEAARSVSKILVVVCPNRKNVLSFDRSGSGDSHLVVPLLWEIGRVREHVLFGLPEWLDAAPAALRSRVAKMEAFVVDVTPRTPQARRKFLRTVP